MTFPNYTTRINRVWPRLGLALCSLAMLSPSFAADPPPTGSANVHQQREAVAESERSWLMRKAQGILAQYMFIPMLCRHRISPSA